MPAMIEKTFGSRDTGRYELQFDPALKRDNKFFV